MNLKNILNRKNLLRIILIFENLFIISLLFYIVITNLKEFKENFFYYFYTFDIFINENYIYLILSLLSVILVILTHLILWKKIFYLRNQKLNYLQTLSLFSYIHFKRLFSPLGPISPIFNINNDLKTSAIIYSTYVYFITLGSFLFFSIFLIFIYPILGFLLPLIFYFSYLIIKKIKLINLKLTIKDYIIFIFVSLGNELFSFFAYYFSLKLFSLNIDFLNSLIIYLIWIIISSLFPFLYGSGTSELITILLINNLGYDSALFGLAIIFYRLIITYLPLLGLIFYKFSYPQFTLDK